jgi:16S rRNA (cytidine1402-2'-O)-methyltransferase
VTADPPPGAPPGTDPDPDRPDLDRPDPGRPRTGDDGAEWHVPDGGASAIGPGLHVAATPIGAARDMTLRALDLLRGADLLLAEDTRSLRRLMEIHAIPLAGRALWAYHDHNGARMRPKVLAALAAGRSVVLVSEAGTPLVADPGFQLVRAAVAAGHQVRAAPGASALLAALTVAGLPTDRFAFLGFAPQTEGARARFLAEVLNLQMTAVIFESPRRIHRTLGECVQIDGNRPAALCRELTKRHEEVIRGTLGQIADSLSGREVRGELVLVVGGASGVQDIGDTQIDAALTAALAGASLRAAVDGVAAQFGLPRRRVYQRALALQAGAGTGEG